MVDTPRPSRHPLNARGTLSTMAPSQESSPSELSGENVHNIPALGSRPSSTMTPSGILPVTLSYSQQPITPLPSKSLSELPRKILIKVLPHLAHQDLVNFAATCKWSHTLAKDTLRKYQDLVQPRSFQTGLVDRKSFTRLYRSIIDNPRLASYVRNLDIWQAFIFIPHHTAMTDPDVISELGLTVQGAERGDFCDFIENHLLCTGGIAERLIDRHALIRSLQNGDEMPTTVFFASLLPNLSSLIFRCDNGPAGRGLSYMETGVRCGLPNTVGERRFCKLKSVEIHGGWHLDNPMNLLMNCAQIPSVEKLVGVRCIARHNRQAVERKMEYQSNVRELILRSCAINEVSIQTLVLGMQLRQFTYTHRRFTHNGMPEPRAAAIQQALLQSSKDCLQTLTITGLE